MPFSNLDPFMQQVLQTYSPDPGSGRMPGVRNDKGENIDQIEQRYLRPSTKGDDQRLTQYVDQIRELGSGNPAPGRYELYDFLLKERSERTAGMVPEKATKLELGRGINNLANSLQVAGPVLKSDEEILKMSKKDLREMYAMWAEAVSRRILEMEASPLYTGGRPEKGA